MAGPLKPPAQPEPRGEREPIDQPASSGTSEPKSPTEQGAPHNVAIPLWLRATRPLKASTQPIASGDLRCKFELFSDWSSPPALTQLPMMAAGVCRGPSEKDWLVISFMANAVPGHNMLSWVEAPLSMIGFPEPAVQPTPELLWWDKETATRDYQLSLGADEVHAFTGLARFSSGVARLYVLLARRQRFAWKVLLSFASAAGGGNELASMRDDDRRAEVVFGALEPASPPD